MRALVTQLRPDKTREKVMVTDWPEPPAPVGNQVKTRTLFSGVTNGTERNDLLRGNYANPDERLPAGWGYQNVGEVVETGPDCKLLKKGDIIYSSAGHDEFATIPEDWLLVKLDGLKDLKPAALYGMAGVATHTIDNAELKMGERVLIVGAGFIGQIAAQVAACRAAHVTLVDVDERRLEIARKIGAADAVLNTSGDGWGKQIADGSYHAVVDVAGVSGMETQLVRAAAYHGRILFIAGRSAINYDFNTGQGREITIKQNSHFFTPHLQVLHHLVLKGRVQIDPLLQEVLPVAEAKGFYDRLRDDPASTYGTVFTW